MNGTAECKDWTWGDLKPLHYAMIHVDLPWDFDTWSDAGQDRAPDYDTMTIGDLMRLPVMDLARPDSLVAFWTFDPRLDQAFDILDAWGFTYKTVAFTWVKPFDLFGAQAHLLPRLQDALAAGDWDAIGAALAPLGKGHWTRANPEICLLASIGKPVRLDAGVRQLILEPAREHSRKPEQAVRRLERLAAGPRCELFARTRRPGWDSWGNQVDLFSSDSSRGGDDDA